MADGERTAPRGIYGLRLLSDPGVQRAGLALIIGLALLFRGLLFLEMTDEIQWGFDFSAYFWAGERVLAGESPYSPHQLAGPYPSNHPQGLYMYPPFLAVIVAPLSAAFDDYRAAAWVWVVVGAAILVSVVVAVSRREGIGSRTDRLLLVGAAFAFAPVVGELIIGNVHLLLLGLFAGAWLAVRRGTPRGEVVAGVCIGVATLVKVFPGLIVAWFLLTGRPRAALASVVTMAVLAAATLPVTGIGPWLDYPTVLLNQGPVTDPRDALAPTIWLSTVMPNLIARIVVAVVALAIVAWGSRRRPAPVSFGIAVAVSILVAPAVYHHYLAILVLPLLLALRHAPPIAWVGVAYLLLSGGEQDGLGDVNWIVNRVLPTAGAVLVVVGLAIWGRDPSRPARVPAG